MNLRRWIITVVACLLVFAALTGYKALQIKKAIEYGNSFPEPSETVEATTVELATTPRLINTIGEIIAPQSIELRNELEGVISAVNFGSGELVHRGQVLLELDSREERARLKAAKARAELAALDLRRIEKLIARKTVSEEQLDQARAKYDVAVADIEALQSVIDKKKLIAPFDARAGIHQLEPGEFIQANTLVTRLVGINDFIWVDFQLPVEQATIEPGCDILVTSARDKQSVSGRVIAKDPALSVNSRNLGYRGQIPDTLQLPPHTIVNVSIYGSQSEALPQVPLTAYRTDRMGAYVYVLLPAEREGTYRARRQSVTAGTKSNDVISIRDGLSGGELVATHGAFKLRENVLVYVKARPDRDTGKPANGEG